MRASIADSLPLPDPASILRARSKNRLPTRTRLPLGSTRRCYCTPLTGVKRLSGLLLALKKSSSDKEHSVILTSGYTKAIYRSVKAITNLENDGSLWFAHRCSSQVLNVPLTNPYLSTLPDRFRSFGGDLSVVGRMLVLHRLGNSTGFSASMHVKRFNTDRPSKPLRSAAVSVAMLVYYSRPAMNVDKARATRGLAQELVFCCSRRCTRR